MTYSNTVEDIMNGNSHNVVIYSNDGPSLNRTSNFVAQSFNTRDFCKNKKYLAELIQTTLEILSAATGMYTKTQIMAKIDFVKTDSTSHNLGVIEIACEEIESEYVPSSLVYHIHPLIMMQPKVISFTAKTGNNEIKVFI